MNEMSGEQANVKLTVHGFDWETEEPRNDDESMQIHGWTLNRDSKPCLVRVVDYPVQCYIELPTFVEGKYVEWSERAVNHFMDWLKPRLTREDEDHSPTEYRYEKRMKTYYYQAKRTYPMILASFRSQRAMQHCENFLSSVRKVEGLGLIKCAVWQTHIPLTRKLMTDVQLRYSQWFECLGVRVPDDERVSSLDEEYYVSWKSMLPVPLDRSKGWVTNPTLLAIDIETYSPNHKAMPKETSAKHVVTSVSLVYQRLGQRNTRKRYCIHINSSKGVPGAELIAVRDETELIYKLCDKIEELDPDIVSGYNIFAYDYPYLDARLKRRMLDWKPMSRMVGRVPQLRSKNWKSGAYGYQSLNILAMSGRISVDLMPIVQRDHKYLPKFNLDTVARHFLDRGKHDVKPEEMFTIFERSNEALDAMKGKLDSEYARAHPTKVRDAFLALMNSAPSAELEEIWVRQLDAEHQQSRVLAYCVEDSELVLDLFEKLNTWIGLVEMSNVVGVTVVEIFTRGQQLRCLNLLYDMAKRRGHVLDRRETPGMSFEGGFVYEPTPGLYDRILCFDFASLYPSIMQAFNICLTTLVPPHLMNDIPADQTTAIEFDQEDIEEPPEEDEHDEAGDRPEGPPKKKKKAKTTVKRSYRYCWVKKEVYEGLIPQIVRELVAERANVRAMLKPLVDAEGKPKPGSDPVLCAVLEQRQLALKYTANSFFGVLGVKKNGKMPLIEAAQCITAKGRQLINFVAGYLKEKHGAKIIYGDTDSCMVDMGIADAKLVHEVGKKLSKEISALFPKPLTLEFEKGMRMLCIKKKMYAAFLITEDGSYKQNKNGSLYIMKKGIASARRDRNRFFYKTYDTALESILLGRDVCHVFDHLVDSSSTLLRGEVPLRDLITIRSVSANYKQENYFMKIFSDNLRKAGKVVNPGDRLDYVVVRCESNKIGPKMRDPEMYLERLAGPNPEPIDYLYYLDHVLLGPIDLLFSIGYKDVLSRIPKAGYQPKGNCTFKHVSEPINMLVYALQDGIDITASKSMLRAHIASLEKSRRVLLCPAA